MLDLLRDWSFNAYFWFMVSFALGCLQLATDEFFFGGACIGAFLTAVTLSVVDPAVVRENVNPSLPYILCGIGGLMGATLMRLACRRSQERSDINEEQWEDERS